MKPMVTFVTANTFQVFRKGSITRFTIFVLTGVTSPGFIWIFFVQFNFVIWEVGAIIVEFILTILTAYGFINTDLIGALFTPGRSTNTQKRGFLCEKLCTHSPLVMIIKNTMETCTPCYK